MAPSYCRHHNISDNFLVGGFYTVSIFVGLIGKLGSKEDI